MKNYRHVTTGQPCDAAQYISEMVCLREAESTNEGQPAFKLWNTDKWKNKYRSQVTKAHQLLKKYDDVAIINALKSNRGKKIYSLRVKFLEPLIKKEQDKFNAEKSRQVDTKEYSEKPPEKPRKPYGKKSTLQKMRELDDEGSSV